MKNIFRHGDISFHPTKEARGERVDHQGSFVLAEGETTGHKHVITVPNVEDMDVLRLADGSVLLTLKSAGTVTHEEHKTLIVPPGTYKIGREREFNYFEKSVQRVQD